MSSTGFLFILAALVQEAAAAGSTEIVDRAELMVLSQPGRPESAGFAGTTFLVQQRGDGSTAVRLTGPASDYVLLLSDSSTLVTESVTFGEYPRVSIERRSGPEPAGSGNVRGFAVIAHYD